MTSYINTTLNRLIQKIKLKLAKPIKNAGRCLSKRRKSGKLKRKFIHSVRTIIGGVPDRKFILNMSIDYKRKRVSDAMFDADVTYHYEGRLTQRVIDDAIASFTDRFQDEYAGCEIDVIKHYDYNIKVISGGALEYLYNYAHLPLKSKICPDEPPQHVERECAIDCMLSFLWNWKHFDRDQLIKDLGSAHPSIRDIRMWVEGNDNYSRYISVYILDPMLNMVYHHRSEMKTRVMMTFYVNEQHVYPITDMKLRSQLANSKRITLEKLTDRISITGDNYSVCSIPKYEHLSKCTKPYVLVNDDDLSAILKDSIIANQALVHQITFQGSRVTMFRHPTTDQCIVASLDYTERKNIADQWYKETKYIAFKFVNQTFCQLARSHFLFSIGELPVESYGPEQLAMFEQCPVIQLISKSDAPYSFTPYSIDCSRNYTYIIESNPIEYPVFHYSDTAIEFEFDGAFVPGEYFIRRPIVMANGNIHIRNGWWPLPMIDPKIQ
jgi:hypothetical protein